MISFVTITLTITSKLLLGRMSPPLSDNMKVGFLGIKGGVISIVLSEVEVAVEENRYPIDRHGKVGQAGGEVLLLPQAQLLVLPRPGP